MSPAMPVARAWGVRRGLREAMPLDGVLQCGVGFDLPHYVPVVTVEDATLRQVSEDYAWPWMGDMTPATRIRMQEQLRARYAHARACGFMSHWAARSAIEDYSVDASKVHVVGVGRNHEPPCPDRDWSVPRALFVGFDWERKNGPAVVRAFAHLRRIWPEARLDIVGVHPPLQEEGVHGHGPLALSDMKDRARIENLFASATFFVMPSLHEPAGIVYAEAQAAGLASIATTSGGASTIVGDAGILVDPLDERAIIDAMLRLADPDTAERLGALASARSSLFTWRAVAERLIRALEPPGVDTSLLAPFLTE